MVHARSLVVALLITGAIAAPAHAGDGSWAWPLDRRDVTGEFDLPDTSYSSGHRGVDVPGRAGDSVRVVAAGRVTFAGSVAGIGVVTIDHGGERSTYQPIDAAVERGEKVGSGDVIGELEFAGSHCASACLHLGRLANNGPDANKTYLDPLERLASTSRVRLVDPDGRLPTPPAGPSGDGTLRRPVGGPITSAFGTRVHPITGVRKLHDGTDFGASCGTPVRAAGRGTVVDRGFDGAYGNRVTVRHGDGLETSYNHLSSHSVSVGQGVSTSTVIGRVGSTGRSTGCHLHFMVRRHGELTDPMTLL